MQDARAQAPGRTTSWTHAFLGLAIVGVLLGAREDDPDELYEAAAEGITEEDVTAIMAELCSPYLEGRDSPSDGQAYATRRVAERFEAFGLEKPPGMDSYEHTYSLNMRAPAKNECKLTASSLDRALELGVDFTPLASAGGTAKGKLVWVGYGIDVRGFDELRGLDIKDAILIFAEGEPRHPRAFDGPDLTPAANAYRKLVRMEELDVAGALMVRRDPPADVERPEGWPEKQPMGYRYTWAQWADERPDNVASSPIPALEISESLARELIGDVYDERLAEIDESGKPADGLETEIEIELASITRETAVPMVNVLGVVPGRDPELEDEFVVVGAHVDHIGVDRRGRIGTGADDNASGTTAMLEMAEALGASPTRRSILFCSFTAEEDGLLGSKALVSDLADGAPIRLEQVVAMVNLDMVGRGDKKSLNAIGADRSRDLDRLVKDARKLTKTGLKRIVTDEGNDLWQRSDHAPFADAGIPAIFIFEETPISKNKDYHTSRDKLPGIELEKVVRAAQFGANLVWLLGEDDDRPSFGR